MAKDFVVRLLSCFGFFSYLTLFSGAALAGPKTSSSAKVAGASSDSAPTPRTSKVAVSEAWVRLPPPGSQMVAVYLTLANHGSMVVQLTGVEVEGAMSSELHETSIDQAGISTMRTLSSLDISPGESKSLAPGGLHVMAMGVRRHLRDGDKLKVTLNFKGQASLQVMAVVRP